MHLYQLTQPSLSIREATRALYQAWRGIAPANRPLRPVLSTEQAEERIAPIERRDRAYRAILQSMDGLIESHKADLIRRGLTETQIASFGFKSLQCSPKRCAAPSGIDTRDVSGFYTYQGARYINNTIGGILIPYCDLWGRIGTLEIRTFETEEMKHLESISKYMRFSSGKPKNGKSECTKSVSTIHHVGIDLKKPPEKVYLTEGALKADVAHALTGKPFIAMAGVNNPFGLEEALSALKAIGVKTVVLCFDMDFYEKVGVQNGLKHTKGLIQKVGLNLRMAIWDKEFKGIDDYYLHQKQNGKPIP